MEAWNKTNDFYNRDVVTCDVWSRTVKRSRGKSGKIYVMDKDNFTYTFSFGVNSEYSMTGCFYECSKIKTIQDAMNALDILIELHLNDKFTRPFINSLK